MQDPRANPSETKQQFSTQNNLLKINSFADCKRLTKISAKYRPSDFPATAIEEKHTRPRNEQRR